MIFATNEPDGFQPESVASLIDRLGPPPPPCGDRLRVEAGELGHDPTAGWNDAQWAQVAVDHQGFLLSVDASVEPVADTQSPRPRIDNRSPRKRFILGRPMGIGIVGVMIAAVLVWLGAGSLRRPANVVENTDFHPPTESKAPLPMPDDASTASSQTHIFNPSMALESLEAPAEANAMEGGGGGGLLPDPMAGLNLTDLIPSGIGEKSEKQSAEDSKPAQPVQRLAEGLVDQPPVPGTVADDPGNLLADSDDDGEVLEVSPQTVSDEGGDLHVRLPDRPRRSDPDEIGDPLTLAGWPPDDPPMSISFSLPNSLQTELAADAVRWTGRQQPVANWTPAAGGWTFRWQPGAVTEADAALLPHGRIDTASGRQIWLRPELTAPAVPLPLASRDTTMQWDLGTPPPPQVTRLDLALDLPEEVDIGWITPVDPAAVRKQTALAVLFPADDEDVRLAMRLDIAATTQLSVRVRWGLRIDPSMPWVWGDAGLVDRSLSELTAMVPRLTAAVPQIEQQMEWLQSAGRRKPWEALDAQLKQIEATIPQAKLAAERYRRLDTMLLHLQAATMSVHLTVQWHDGTVQHLIRPPAETPRP